MKQSQLFNFKEKLLHISFQNFLFNFVSIVIIAIIIKRGIEIFNRIDLYNFQNVYLWKCLTISLTAYGIILFLAFAYTKFYIKTISISIFFVGLLFSLYFLSLINVLILKFPDTLFIRFCLIVLFIPIIYKIITNKRKENYSKIGKNNNFPKIIYALIFLWLMHSFLYFSEYNFNFQRVPYGDEASFWFLTSNNMISQNFLKSHLTSYPGSGGGHPLGVPFICAYPIKFFGLGFTETIFFMPLVVIIALLLFLHEIKFNKWCFLFFYLALFNTFNNYGWIGQLCYRLIYGEGISMVFFLLIAFEIRKLIENGNIKINVFLLMNFFIGLLSLSKFPLFYFSLLFGTIFILLFSYNKIKRVKKFLLLAFAILISPSLVLKLFNFLNSVDFNPVFEKIMDIKGKLSSNSLIFAKINLKMIKNVISDLINNCPDAIYYSILSIILIGFSFRKKEFVYLIPILSLIFVTFFYYAFIYTGSDSGSSIRYLMPQLLALFYFGGVGFNRVIMNINQHVVNVVIKNIVQFSLVVLILAKLF